MVIVIYGLYVFFHHEGDFKVGATQERTVQNMPRRDSNPKDYESDALPPELIRSPDAVGYALAYFKEEIGLAS